MVLFPCRAFSQTKDATGNAERLGGNVATVIIPYRGADTNNFINAASQRRGVQPVILPRSEKNDFFSTANRETESGRSYDILGSINLSVTVIPSTCGISNGSMMIVPDGGTPPYSFYIGDGSTYRSGNFPNKAAGAYMVKVTDAKGEKAMTEVIIENLYPKPTLKASSYSAAKTCSSGDATITLEATGGCRLMSIAMTVFITSRAMCSRIFMGGFIYFLCGTRTDVSGHSMLLMWVIY